MLQFQQGLNDVGKLWDKVIMAPDAYRYLFINRDAQLNVNDIRPLFKFHHSEQQQVLEKEEETVYCWEEFLRKAEGTKIMKFLLNLPRKAAKLGS